MRYIVFSTKDMISVALFIATMFFIAAWYVSKSETVTEMSSTIEDIIKDYESDRVVEGSLRRVHSVMNN